MNSLLIILALNCPTTKIENHTDKWTDYDEHILKTAKKRCGEIYKESPCVKVFIKKEEQLYNVVCGK